MEKTAFIYPGQGSQTVGMGISLVEQYPQAADIFEKASALAGYDMIELCANGPVEKLSRTLYTQPALFTVEAAITDVLKVNGIEPAFAAGHSLGEYGAWYAANVFSFEDGFKLVSERGQLMDEADPEGIGTMSAVIGLSRDIVESVCKNTDGIVVVANCNSPLQHVISGEKGAVDQAGKELKAKGAKRVLPLKVSGAFHSPLMENALSQFTETVNNTSISEAVIPVYANVTASPVKKADEIRTLMIQQLVSTVRWTETVQAFKKGGISRFFETGPGQVLAGLLKRIDASLDVRSVSGVDEIQELNKERS
ncbi:MAG: ACP S-malonyltransferase [Candidatus Latescibacteria bacterium]|nr:ACP S-malonyltransferase [Candidatus Latescibacterota bacterium]